jgi:adenylate kinase
MEERKNTERLKSVRKKLDELKERERQILETKSQVLRQYLAENVIPYLGQGILEICQTLPDDPVQVLSDFLLEKSLEIKKQNAQNK